MGAEPDFPVVYGEVGHAAAELEEFLPRVAVLLVLPDCIVHRLLGEAVLQFEGEGRKAVDEEADVECELGPIAAVSQLPCDGEAVLLEALLCLHIVRRRRAEEKVELVGAMLDAVPQHIDGSALGDLALEPGQELASRRPIII